MPVREASRLGQLFIVKKNARTASYPLRIYSYNLIKKSPVRLVPRTGGESPLTIYFYEKKMPVWLHTRTGNYSYNTKKKEIVRGDPPPHLRQFSSLLKRKKMPVWLHTSVGYYNYFCTFAPEIEFYYRAHP